MVNLKNNKKKVVASILATGILVSGSSMAGVELYQQNKEIEQLMKNNTKLEEKLEINLKELKGTTEVLKQTKDEFNQTKTKLLEQTERTETLGEEVQKLRIENQNKQKKINEQQKKMNEQRVSQESPRRVSQQASVSRGQAAENSANWVRFESTAYTSFCPTGCTGETATGIDVSQNIYYQGMRVIAVDPSVIPLWSIVDLRIDGRIERAIALDTGGVIKGRIVDYLIHTNDSSVAYAYGRKQIELRMVRYGKG